LIQFRQATRDIATNTTLNLAEKESPARAKESALALLRSQPDDVGDRGRRLRSFRENAHRENECVEVQTLETQFKVLTHVLSQLLGGS
jgi:acetylornithine deacetylase/succinyl-diaminopimelate desuccinylase-like protein